MDLSKITDLNDLQTLLQTLLDLMAKHGLSELELEGEGRKIRMKKFDPHQAAPAIPFAAAPVSPGGGAAAGYPQGAAALAAGSPSSSVPAAPINLFEVKSPMVGTFYRAPSPEADPFVREGDRVEESAVLCIIEAMKVMNEITSGVTGVVREILVRNGESVEFGQGLFRIQTE